ncbi:MULTISPECIES: acyl-CoA thioesterase [Flavobacteriaceae]|uniref:Acyl-CoA thioesterase n=2 Tax=Flavobacteriaceae TaxID=49546 RepID=A0A4Y8ANR2_9FLAO|nr:MULTISPECIES: thioesterase family protein [Flavobacteriaceae]TEW72096.1 acyl-CoA thioesterase [Gramella jeungdoensis]GGK56364.1 thioesterase [Lutibacter litoralis]
MISDKIEFRVRYGETDQMSYAYHGNYAAYFEMGRTEWLRKLGVSYKKMEEDGIMLPVINLNTNYLKPAKYDDILTLKTTLANKPAARIEFKFEITNQQNELLTTASATLVFVNMKTNRPTRIPKYLLDKLNIKE